MSNRFDKEQVPTVYFGEDLPPIRLIDLRKQYGGEFKPTYGWGTGSGDIVCPICRRRLGWLLELTQTLDVNDVSKATVIGKLAKIHTNEPTLYTWMKLEMCPNAGKTVDYSAVTLDAINQNSIPGAFFERQEEWKEILKKDAELAGTTVQRYHDYI